MALVKLRARLRTEGTRQITQSDRRTNEQAIAVAKGEDQLPPFIAAGTFRWREIRRAYQQTAAALDATGQADDRELAKDVRTFLDKHQGMNATPEVFAAHHAKRLDRSVSPMDAKPPDHIPPDKGRGR
jgi:hypothetical protein